MSKNSYCFGIFLTLAMFIPLSSVALAQVDMVMPIDNLPGYSFYPCDSGTCSRQPSDPRTWYSIVYRGKYGIDPPVDWTNRFVGSGSHPGVDIAVPRYTRVKAIYGGTIVDVFKTCIEGVTDETCGGGWGNHVIIRHEGIRNPNEAFFSIYAHLDSVEDDIQFGKPVTKGQLIGLSGNTGHSDGAHLHFQIDREKRLDNPNIFVSHPYWPVITDNRNIDDPDKEPPLIEYSTYNPIGFIIDHQVCGILKSSWEFKGPDPLATIPSNDIKKFDGYAEGWIVHNIDNYSVSNEDPERNGVLYIDPGASDPWIQNDSISFAATDFDSVEICMASDSPDGTGAIYFITDASTNWDEDKKISFPITNDGQYHVLDPVRVSDNVYWTGTITGIRIDPADQGIAGSNSYENRFDYIRLVKNESVKKPNLTPCRPSGWEEKIVVSKSTGTSTNTIPLYTKDTLYVDWAIINSGTASISTLFYTQLYVDGVLKKSWSNTSLGVGSSILTKDFNIGKLSSDTHTIKIVADSLKAIDEVYESDNEYTKTIAVTEALIYSVSGKVSGGGTGISGVTVTLSGVTSKTATTDGSGNYSFTDLGNGTYTVTPNKSGDAFSPANRSVTISGANKTGINYSAYPVITSINPTSGQGGIFDLTINGRYFASNVDDRIYWKQDMHYVGSGSTVSSNPTQLVCRENMGTLGAYVVKVRNPDGLMSNGTDLTITSNAYLISGISPNPVKKNKSVTFTLTGKGFQSGFTAKYINELGTQYDPISTLFVSSTQVKVTVFIGPGPTSTQKIRIINPDGQWREISFTANAGYPAPTISSISPSAVTKNQSVTFTLTGGGFQSGFTAKYINELGTQYNPQSTQYVSATTVKVTAFLGPGPTSTQKIRIINPDAQWAEISFTAQESYPAPTITKIIPNPATKNQTVTFTLTGTGFQKGFTAKYINELGTQYDPQSTQYVSATTVKVTVFLGSGPTSTQKIRITNPDGQWQETSFTALENLTISSISPSTVTKNQSVTFTLTGGGFQSGFTAKYINELGTQYNPQSTQYVNATTVKVTVFLGPGPTSTQKIRITNPGGQWAEISFTAQAGYPTPTITKISPNPATKNQTVTFTLTGTGFQSGFSAKIINELNQEWDITQKEYVSSIQVKVTVLIGAGSQTSTQYIKIINPDGQSAQISFTALGSTGLTITSISPSTVTKGQTVTFTLTGTGFQNGFTAKIINELSQEWDIPQKEYVSSTTVKVTLLIGAGSQTSTQYIKIINPDSQSAQISFTATGNNPTLTIDGGTSSSKPRGGTYNFAGSNYTPNRTVTRYLRQPDGSTITLTPAISANGNGEISWSYTSISTTPLGTYSVWVVDDDTGRTSNTVTEIVT